MKTVRPRRYARHHFIESLEARIAPALLTTLTWQGDLATTGWNDGTVNTDTNWLSNLSAQRIPIDGNILVFPDSGANKTNVNDIAGLDLKSLSFTGTGYNITGSPITLAGGIKANLPSANSSAFHPVITLAADQTFTVNGPAGASISLDTLDLGGKTLTVDGTAILALGFSAGTKLTGQGTIVKNGTGGLNFSHGNDFIGTLQLNGGNTFATFIDTLGTGGAGNGTTVASGATLTLGSGVTGTLAEDLTLSGAGAAGQHGALATVTSNGLNLTGALRLGGDATIDVFNGATLTLGGLVGAADDALGILTVSSSVTPNLAFANTATLTTELAGTTPGAGGHDQLKVLGTVDLGGATLNVVPSFTPAAGAKFVIVDNDGVETITGTFKDQATGMTLSEGAAFTAGGVNFTISYKGINGAGGNDVVLTVASLVKPPLPVTLSADGKTATYIDVDGDNVTVKTTKGPFQQTDFSAVATGVAGGGQLQQINLTTHPADFAGANLTITAKPGPLGGNGFVNVGYLNATGIDLGAVSLAGDLGRIAAGTVGGEVKVPGVKSLTVESIGLLGTSTQDTNGNLASKIEGALPKLLVKGDVRDADIVLVGTDGRFGTVTLGGSLVGTVGDGSFISAGGGIGTVKIGGDIRAASTTQLTGIVSAGAIGAVTIGGGIEAADGARVIEIFAFGQTTAPKSGVDLAIKSLTVSGSVQNFLLKAGLNSGRNADASIGSVTVTGDWIASSILAGMAPGGDNRNGTADDVKVLVPDRDNPALFSSIGSLTIKGQALGTAGVATDMFGVVAERIGKAKVGGRTFAFKADTATVQNHEAFFAAPTGPGKGAATEVLPFDFTIRELNAANPVVALAVDFDLGDGKTVSFTDVDGDRVTVKRSAGTFVQADFQISTAASGGGQFDKLTVTAALNGALTNLTITAKPGPGGGNGFVNLGELSASVVPLGAVRIAGDVEKLSVGSSITALPGTGSFSAHSLGVVTTGATQFAFRDGLGKLSVERDVAEVTVLMTGVGHQTLGSVSIGGNLQNQSVVSADDGIGSVRIGGSVLDGRVLSLNGAIGAITVGGDVVGNATNRTFGASGQLTAPAKGLDLAIKSLTVKGSVENALVQVGLTNADASIGALSVGRAWLASSVLAGVQAGTDPFFGTSDDAKITAPLRDVDGRFSTITSLTIKGQALGTPGSGDSFGIVAEVIGKAKIGARTFAFKAGTKEAFAAAPTGPGPAPDNAASDFFVREIGAV